MEITNETANQVLDELIKTSVVRGVLTINSVNALIFLNNKADKTDELTAENSALKAKVSELETLFKTSNEKKP